MYASTDKNIKLQKLTGETAVIYIRVSHPRQVTNYSIPTQLESCREYLKNRNIQEVGVFIEEGESAKTDDRHQLQSLLYFLSHNKGKVTYVLVYKIDRWARNQEDHFFMKTLLKKYKCKLISVSESIDETPLGKFIEGLFANLSQLDNDLKAERTRACLTTKALSGNYPGKAPYGYKNDPATKTIQVDKKYFKHIKECLVMFANGTNLEDLIAYLKIKKVKTKLNNKKISQKVIKKILDKSMFYAGKYNWGLNNNIQGTYEKMISWEQHLAIQDRLVKKKNIHTISQQKLTSPFWLNFNYESTKGFLNCSNCEMRILSCFAKSERGRKYPYYFCKNNQCKIKKKSIPKDTLEVMVENDLFKQLPSRTQVRNFKLLMSNQWEKEYESIKLIHKQISTGIQHHENNLFLEQSLNSNNISIDALCNVRAFPKYECLVETLEKFEAAIYEVNRIYICADFLKKQNILQLVYPSGVLVSYTQIVNVSENILFRLIKGFEPSFEPDTFICGDINNRMSTFLQNIQ